MTTSNANSPSSHRTGSPDAPSSHSSLAVFWLFLRLGCVAFGGPAAHLAYFRKEIIEQRQWFSEQQFATWLAICQFLPGPASSQMGFMLGLQRAGWRGGLAAFLAFTSPSVILLILFASVVPALNQPLGVALIHGLKLAAGVIVADAVWGMAKSFCRSKRHVVIAVCSLVLLLAIDVVWMQLAVVVIGALVSIAVWLQQTAKAETTQHTLVQSAPNLDYSAFYVSPTLAKMLFVTFVSLLIMLPVIASWLAQSEYGVWAHISEVFYRTGALVFGGGHVVLPWLEQEIVSNGSLSAGAFIAGYGATQAVPGPMFTFAAYLGALMPASQAGLSVAVPDVVSIAGALLAVSMVFLPGFLLLLAALPVWRYMSRFPLAKAALAGVNAAVVGLLAAAWYDPIITSAVISVVDILIVVIGFCCLRFFQVSALWIVVGCVTASIAIGVTGASFG